MLMKIQSLLLESVTFDYVSITNLIFTSYKITLNIHKTFTKSRTYLTL